MDGVPFLEWLYVAAAFCAFAWLMWKQTASIAGRMRTGKFGAGELLQSVLSLICGGGLLWFILWILTDGLVPQGLYGFGIAAAALVVVFVVDAITRKRNG